MINIYLDKTNGNFFKIESILILCSRIIYIENTTTQNCAFSSAIMSIDYLDDIHPSVEKEKNYISSSSLNLTYGL